MWQIITNPNLAPAHLDAAAQAGHILLGVGASHAIEPARLGDDVVELRASHVGGLRGGASRKALSGRRQSGEGTDLSLWTAHAGLDTTHTLEAPMVGKPRPMGKGWRSAPDTRVGEAITRSCGAAVQEQDKQTREEERERGSQIEPKGCRGVFPGVM